MKNLIRIGIVGLVLVLLPCLTISPSVSATGNVSYGMYEYCSNVSEGTYNASDVSWYASSNFDWILLPYYTGINTTISSQLNAGGKDVILVTRTHYGNISSLTLTWTDLYNSYLGNKSYYNEAMGYITSEINGQGASNLYAITIYEEEPDAGYWGGAVNISHFTAVHNQMYTDLKVLYPTLKIFPFIHIASFTNGELTSLTKDGLVDDVYTSNLTTLSAWFTRMITYGGSDTYCLVNAAGGLNTGYQSITPSVVRDTDKLASSLSVPHLGWYAHYSAVPHYSILFNTWSACTGLNDPYCAKGYQDTMLGIINHTQNILNLEYKVSYSTDDAGINEDVWTTNAVQGTMGDYYGAMSTEGFLFRTVTTPTIGSLRYALFRLYTFDTAVVVNASVDVYAEDTATPVTFINSTNFNARIKTTAHVTYNATWARPLEEASDYLNITSPVSELLASYDYTTGKNISLLFYGLAGGAHYNVSHYLTFNGGAAYGAELHLEYNMPIYVGNYTASSHGVIIGDSPQNIYYGESGTTIIAAPNYCCHFVNWSDAYPTATRNDLNVLANISVTANFALDVFTLTYTNGSNGGILGNLSQTVSCGSNGSAVLAVANTGYHFTSWNDSSIANPRTDTSVLINKSVTANFVANAPPAPPASIGGTMGTIVVIVFGMVVILMLMGYTYSEYQRQGFTEGAKVAILGIITIVIAESILIAFF